MQLFFSQVSLEKGLVERLIAMLGTGEPTLQVSGLWAKNRLRKGSIETTKDAMYSLGWERLTR